VSDGPADAAALIEHGQERVANPGWQVRRGADRDERVGEVADGVGERVPVEAEGRRQMALFHESSEHTTLRRQRVIDRYHARTGGAGAGDLGGDGLGRDDAHHRSVSTGWNVS
jgi:hypothetical protein